MKIISGGQTGADQAGLAAALNCGLATGGCLPRGCRTENGPAPWLIDAYGMYEHASASYVPRTIANAESSDTTIWFGRADSPGARVTIDACLEANKSFMVNPTNPRRLAEILLQYKYRTVNIAGNRESKRPGIYGRVYVFLCETFSIYADLTTAA